MVFMVSESTTHKFTYSQLDYSAKGDGTKWNNKPSQIFLRITERVVI